MGADHRVPGHASTVDAAPRVPHVEPGGSDVSAVVTLVDGAVPKHVPPSEVPGRQLRRISVDQLQRSHGNAFVGRLLGGAKAAAVQRHPEGTAMSHDPAAAGAEIADPPPLPEGGVAAPATDGAGAAAASAGAGEGTAASAETPAPATADGAVDATETEPATGKTGEKAPAPATPKVMDLAKAQEVLTKSYGKIKTIVPGKIVILADREAIWKQYDTNNKGRQNPYNGNRPWVDGDAKKYIPGLDGFASKSLGTVYVNEQTTLATATAHEMLHNNTEAGFRAAVGETINEGATEFLAIKALKAAGVSTASGTAYPGEVGFVTKLAKLVGEDTLIAAYFGGAAKLVDKFNELQGAGEFAKLKPLAEAKNYAEAEKLLKHDLTKI